MFGLPKSGNGMALDRLRRFYADRGVDVERLARRSIVITGSNGKGSTARFVSGALNALGLRVGCFTSPHLYNVRERFELAGATIPQNVFDELLAEILAYNAGLAADDRIGAFEAMFMMAALWFEREPVDVIVWEAGIGGRYDPVRTVAARVSALTSVELEHTELLGPTEELIAYDKIDALAPGGTLIVSSSVPASLDARIATYCSLTARRPLFVRKEIAVRHVVSSESGVSFVLGAADGPGTAGRLALIGDHQVSNALTALAAAEAWLGGTGDRATMMAGLARVRWPGRLERISVSPDAWIDVGHTPGAVACVTRVWKEFRDPAKTLPVFGVSYSKEVRKIASLVASRFPRAILTRAHKAGADPATFAADFAECDAVIIPDIAEAARVARIRASEENLSVLALGGLFLAIELQHAWNGGDPRTLEFF